MEDYKRMSEVKKEIAPLCLVVDPLPSWDWVINHQHDLDDYKPHMEIITDKLKTTLSNNLSRKVIREIIRGA